MIYELFSHKVYSLYMIFAFVIPLLGGTINSDGHTIALADGTVLPVFEIMVANPAIRNLIREEKTYQIDSVIAAGSREGMRTMDQSLFELVSEGKITTETALSHAIHPTSLEHRLETEGIL